MNSLTTPPPQHAFKASTTLLSGIKHSKNITDPDFRTYNPDIFPSLSPFSNFYNKKKQNEARTSCRSCSDDLEPVKKYKLDNGSSKIVPPTSKMIPSPISPETKNDKDSFRVPRLPKRFCEKKSLSSSAKVAPIGNFNNSAGEPGLFAGKDNLMQDQKGQGNVAFPQPIEWRSHTETAEKAENQLLHQDNENFYPRMDTSLLNSLYERFKLEFFLLQCGQQVNNSGMKRTDAHQIDSESSDMNMEDLIARSKDLLKEQIKKTEINC